MISTRNEKTSQVDWFFLLESDQGNLKDSLLLLEKDLSDKLEFIHSMKSKLCDESSFDKLSILTLKIDEFEKKVKNFIDQKKGQMQKINSTEYSALCKLASPLHKECFTLANFQILGDVLTWDEKVLPDSLASQSLMFFLKRFKKEILQLQKRVDFAMSKLQEVKEAIYHNNLETEHLLDPKSKVDDLRQQFKQRRLGSLQKKQHELDEFALTYMGFQTLPDKEELKKRYRILAKKYHPDVDPKASDAFKKLVKSYRHLEKRIGRVDI